jgi:WD40 repeat protein
MHQYWFRSPDGTCLVSNSNDSVVRLFEPYTSDAGTIATLSPTLSMRHAESVNDVSWYPFMTSQGITVACSVTRLVRSCNVLFRVGMS